jgi:hypothetical protein
MKRVLPIFLLCAGCALPPEREALRPLPEAAPPLTYPELFTRARLQAAAAMEAFYADNWLELEQTAQVLEQTARHLPKAAEQPANVKKTLAEDSEALRHQATKLAEAARAKNVQSTNETLQRIQLAIRTLRPADRGEKEKEKVKEKE